MRPTVKDIARHAGVSPATVSLVLRDSPLVADATRAGVRSSIDSLGYVYHRAAANLRTRLTHTVGLIICEITNPFYAELAAGIDDVLDQAGWVAFVANTAELPARQSRFIARMREHRVDGILLTPAEGTSADVVNGLRRQGVPVVQMLRRVGEQSADYVSADFRLGMNSGRRTPDPPRAPTHCLRWRRASRVAREGPHTGLPRDPSAVRIAGRRHHRLPADAGRGRSGGRAVVPRTARTRRPRCFATTTSAHWASCWASSTSA